MSTLDRREPMRLDVTLKYNTEGEFMRGFACNVSPKAIFLKTQTPKPVGTPVRVQLKLRSGEIMLAGDGRVLWSYESPLVPLGRQTGMGIQFECDNVASGTRIQQMVHMEGSGRYAWAPGVRLFAKLLAPNEDSATELTANHTNAQKPHDSGTQEPDANMEGLTADWIESSEFELVPTGHNEPKDVATSTLNNHSSTFADPELPYVNSADESPPTLPNQDASSPAFEAAVSEAFDMAPTVPMTTAQPPWMEPSTPLIESPPDPISQAPNNDEADPPSTESAAPRPSAEPHERAALDAAPTDRPAPALVAHYWIVGGVFKEPWPAHHFEWPEKGTKRPISETPLMLDDDLWAKLTGSPNRGDWTSEDPFASPAPDSKDAEFDIPLRSIAVANSIASTEAPPNALDDDRGFDDVFASSDPEMETAPPDPEPDPESEPGPQTAAAAAPENDTDAQLDVDWSKEVFSSVDSEKTGTRDPRRPYETPLVRSQAAEQIEANDNGVLAPRLEAESPATAEEEITDEPPARIAVSKEPPSATRIDETSGDTASKPDPSEGGISLSSAVGIALPGGRMRVLLERGTRAPYVFNRNLTVPRSASRLEINLYQGDADQVEACSSLACIVVETSNGKTNERRSFDVCIRLSEDGVLEVEARAPSGTLATRQRVATLDATATGRRRVAAKPQTTSVADTSDESGGFLSKIKSRFLRGRT